MNILVACEESQLRNGGGRIIQSVLTHYWLKRCISDIYRGLAKRINGGNSYEKA